MIQFCPMKTKSKPLPSTVIVCLKILMSGIGIVEARGKLGGTVFTKNRSGAACRVKTTSVNRRTPFQQAVRIAFGFFASAFRSLTASQVAAWNAAASSGFKTNNIFGNPVSGSGLNLYVGLNSNLATAGVASISDPPTQDVVESPLGISPSAADGANTMFLNAEFDGGTDVVPANTFIVVFATPPVSNGVSFVKSQLREFSSVDAAGDTGTTNLHADYVTRFGAPAAGQKIFLQAVAINKTSGQAGPPLLKSLVVAA